MGSTSGQQWVVSTAVAADHAEWARLYRAYGAVAGRDLSEQHLARVWSWVQDPAGQTRCLLLRPGPGRTAVGLAHHRRFERPLAGDHGCYLDDLFVDPAHRGRGGARALLEHLRALAAREGWSTVRWTTKPTNPAQRLYDQLAERAAVVTYDMAPDRPARPGR